MREFVETKVKEIKRIVGKEKVIAACSGGVDSTVAALLVKKAIGKRLLPVFVDSGLLRKNEADFVIKRLKRMGLKPKFVKAEKLFLKRLEGITEPEEKRQIIGKCFIEIFEREAKKFKAKWLVQGTIAPDWIESGSKNGLRARIKSHHNVAGLPEKMKLRLIEPLKDLYKDEVRKLAKFFGIKSSRQPFPGPGLAVRIIGEVTKEKLDLLRGVDYIIRKHIVGAVKKKIVKEPWQYFPVLLNDKATGVQGDLRAYGYVIAIRCVESVDGMTANASKLPFSLLEEIASEITNKFKEVTRVVYDLTSKPPATIEWE